MSERTTIYLDDSQAEIVEELMAKSWGEPEIPRIDSKSEILRHLIDLGIGSLPHASVDLDDGEVSGEDLLELLDDETILSYRRDARKKEAKPLFRGSKIAERFSEKADQLFEGAVDEKATPLTIERIAESYLAELEDHEELSELDSESVDRQKRAIRERVEEYRSDYENSENAPREVMRPTPDESRLGAEFGRLRESRESVVESLREKAESERFNSVEPLLKALAYDYGVSVEAVEILLDALTPDGTDGRLSLKSGSGIEVPDLLDESLPEPEETIEEIEVERNGSTTAGGYSDGAIRAGFRVEGDLSDMTPEEIERAITDGGDS